MLTVQAGPVTQQVLFSIVEDLEPLQCHSRSDLAALDEGRPFNISPDGQIFDQRRVGRSLKQSAGRTTVLSVIHTEIEREEEIRESSPRRSHPHIATTVRRPSQGRREGPISRGSPRVSGARRVGEVHIRQFSAIQ